MKPLYYSLTALLLSTTFSLSGCSESSDQPATPDGETLIQLAPSVEEAGNKAAHRSGASALTDLSGKPLMLDITQNATTPTDSYNYNGLKYNIANDGSGITFESGTPNNEPPRWKAYTGSTERSNVTIKAQWPLATAVPADQSGVNHAEADFFYYDGTPTIDGNRMEFTLKHVNAKIRINLILGTGFEWGTDIESEKTISIATSGLQNETESANNLWKADANGVPVLSSGSTTTAHKAHQETTAVSGQDATFELIILPQTVADMTEFLTITAGKKTYHYSMTGQQYIFESNKTYTFNLRVGKDKVELNGGIGVTGWTEDNTIPGGESEDESRVQNIAALSALISANNDKYTGGDTSLSSVIYTGNDAIGKEAFKNSLWLSRFAATQNITIGSEAFNGCTNLGELVFADKETMNGITQGTFAGLTTTNVKLILGEAEYKAIPSADLTAKAWRGMTWKSITRY